MDEDVTFTLTGSEALVLLDMLNRWDKSDFPESLPLIHEAERWLLSDLLAVLERQVSEPFRPDYRELVEQAQNNVQGERKWGLE